MIDGMDDAFISVVVVVSVAALVVAFVVLATSSGSYDEIGRGGLSLEEPVQRRETYADVVAEVRGFVEAANARRAARGEPPLDVDAEVMNRLREL